MEQGNERLPYFGAPPTRTPRPARTESALHGKRVILSTPDGFVYDMRAVSAIYTASDAGDVVDILTEEDYYRWMLRQVVPTPQPFPARLVWVE
ncbi:hypothetical protein GCM10027601_21150 [Nocardioides ungokensis]|uniref:hypothetical protein n=1 Tax=Nocardioides ungokensis TaxID=1643322 RepID=UPI0015DE8FE4|nr:hypothetical protein [Nocardioides ungokensis]